MSSFRTIATTAAQVLPSERRCHARCLAKGKGVDGAAWSLRAIHTLDRRIRDATPYIVWRSHTHERKQRECLVSCFTSVCTTPAGYLQSNQIAELVTRHASSSTHPEFEQAKQPTWTFEPEANVNTYDFTSSNVRKVITSSHSFGTNR